MARQTKEEKAIKRAIHAKTPRGRSVTRQANLRYLLSEKGVANRKKAHDKWNAKKKSARDDLHKDE
jgi:hypothetical protein